MCMKKTLFLPVLLLLLFTTKTYVLDFRIENGNGSGSLNDESY